MIVNEIEVKVNGIEGMTNAEIENYIHLVYEKTHEKIHSLDLTAAKDGKVDIHYILQPQKFERIRRITGYLVGTTYRWNNAKQAEEHARVKHNLH